jgi:hypothetical protein
MWVPLVILAIPSVLLGFVPFGSFVYRGEVEHAGIDLAIAIPATLAGLTGIGLSALLYGRKSGAPARVAASLGFVYRAIAAKFYFDEIYLFVTHKIIFRFVSAPLMVRPPHRGRHDGPPASPPPRRRLAAAHGERAASDLAAGGLRRACLLMSS